MDYPLGAVLASLDDFSWKDWLYIARDAPINVDCQCFVINPDDDLLADDGATPIEVAERDLVAFLSVADLRGIQANLTAQMPSFDFQLLLRAVKYYSEHDAYLAL